MNTESEQLSFGLAYHHDADFADWLFFDILYCFLLSLSFSFENHFDLISSSWKRSGLFSGPIVMYVLLESAIYTAFFLNKIIDQ